MRLIAGGVALEVEVHGRDDAEPLLLIMGLGMQLLGWPDGLVDQLVQAGFRVIRFDNRDVGLSQDFDDAGVPNLGLQALRHALQLRVESAYSLADMAGDTVAVLDALGIESSHVCGASMGGMVAQHVAARHPQRVRSLTLMMTTSGAKRTPGPTWPVRSALLSKPRTADDIDAVVAHYQRFFRVIGSPAFPTDPEVVGQQVRQATKRSWRPAGTLRQMLAIAADGDRTPLLRTIRVPTRIVHGSADPMLPPACAFDLASKIDGAGLDLIEGMGHDLPEALWPRFVTAIASAAQRAAPLRTGTPTSAASRRDPDSAA